MASDGSSTNYNTKENANYHYLNVLLSVTICANQKERHGMAFHIVFRMLIKGVPGVEMLTGVVVIRA